MSLDEKLFRWINNHVGEYSALDALTRLLVNEYFVPVTLALGILFLWFAARPGEERERWQRAVLVAALAVGIANLLVKLSNLVWVRERPFHQAVIDMLFYKPIDPSFPANSAAVGFAIATGVWLYDRRVAPYFWVPAVALPLSRVFAGVHYPSDIAGGALIGVFSALVALYTLRRIEPVVLRLLAAMRRLGVA